MRAISSITSISRVTSSEARRRARARRSCPVRRADRSRAGRGSRPRAPATPRAPVMCATRSMRTRSCARGGRSAADVDRVAASCGAPHSSHEQPRRGARGDRREVRVDALLPAVRGLACAGRAAATCAGSATRVKLAASSTIVVVSSRDLGVGAAHDARRCPAAPSASAITQHRRVELALLAVERAQRLARPRAPRRQRARRRMRAWS